MTAHFARTTCAVAIGALALAGPAFGQSGATPRPADPVQPKPVQKSQPAPRETVGKGMPIQDTKEFAQHTGALQGSVLMGMKVRDVSGKEVGKVEDLILGSNGHVSFAVVSFGGFMGLGEKLYAVPWNAIMYDVQAKEARLDVSRETLDRVPSFARGEWPDDKDRTWADEARRGWSDAAITAAVKAKLARDRAVPAMSVDVDTDGGVVKLSGSVPNEGAKQRATALARQVEGVRRVENRLDVKG